MAIQTLDLSSIPPQRLALAQATASPAGILPVQFLGPVSLSGQLVGVEQSMRCGIVLACIRILAETLAGLPLQLLQRTPKGAIPATGHQLYRLLGQQPNPWQTHFELIEAMVVDILLNGSAYALKQYDSQGRIAALVHLPADRIQLEGIVIDEVFSTPQLKFRYSGPEGGKVFLQDQLWRADMMAPLIGHSRALRLLAREAIGLSLAAEEQGARLFSHGIQSDLTLSTADNLDKGQREQLRDNLLNAYAGSRNAFNPLLLEGGLTATRIGLTAQESQYIESRKFQGEEIARIFRIPGVLLGIGDKTATFASAEQFFMSFVKFTVNPWLIRFEETIQRDLLSPSESDYYPKFNVDALQRADLKTRYDSYAVGITSGFLLRSDAREFEDLPQIDGIDTPSTPVNAPSAPAERLAERLAAVVTTHEAKLIADGRPLDKLPAFICDKTGLSAEQAAAYVAAKPEEKVALLKAMLLKV